MPTRKKTSEPTARVIVDNTTGEPIDHSDDEARIDQFEKRANDYILDPDDGDEPGAADESKLFDVDKLLPRFSNFRSNPETIFEMWGVSDRQGMDDLVFFASKTFAPVLEDEGEVDLRRVRVYETATRDGVIRLIYCFVPEKGTKKPNLWQTSKEAALELSKTCWTTMRTRRKLQQYAFRPSNKQEGEPQFSGLSVMELIDQLREQGLVVEDKEHPFYKRAADLEE